MKWLGCALALSPCVAPPASAQEAAKKPLVGVLLINTAANPEPVVPLFRNALAGLGYVEDRNLRLEFRFAEGHVDRFMALAAALVGNKANVVVAIADDLVAAGLVQSMTKPGGNTTGISILATELDAKKVEILKEIVPAARDFALLRDPASSTEARLRAIAEMARALGLELQTVDVESPADFAAAFATLRAGGAEALDILASPLLANFQSELGRLTLEYKLPAICQFREMVKAGCLASYGVKRQEMYAMLAAYVDKMLKGAKPGETVAQQPSAVELVINQKTAQKIGIELPRATLARADEVIE